MALDYVFPGTAIVSRLVVTHAGAFDQYRVQFLYIARTRIFAIGDNIMEKVIYCSIPPRRKAVKYNLTSNTHEIEILRKSFIEKCNEDPSFCKQNL